MTDIRVHHLNCAHLRRLSLGGLPLACRVLLVETPASGLVLVDSGLGTADYAGIAPGSGGDSPTATPGRRSAPASPPSAR
jgi:hypothetical protein